MKGNVVVQYHIAGNFHKVQNFVDWQICMKIKTIKIFLMMSLLEIWHWLLAGLHKAVRGERELH